MTTTITVDEVKLMARWSHKHLAHLVNLGRFGIHHMLITPAGSTGRLGSLVSEAELGDHPLIETQEACLLKAGKGELFDYLRGKKRGKIAACCSGAWRRP